MNAGTISLILTLLFVLILFIGFWIGFWRGLKKSTLNLGLSIISAIVAFFCSGPLTKALLGIKIPYNGAHETIDNVIVSLIRDSNQDIAFMMDNTPSMKAFIQNLPYALGNVIVFILLAIVAQFVMYIIYAIFAAILIKKRDSEGNKLPRHRWTGGVIGVLKTFLLSLFVVMPLMSLVDTAYGITSAQAQNNGETQNEAVIPPLVNDILGGVKKSAFGVLGGAVNLDDAMFDYLSEFKINGEKVQIRKEIQDYSSLVSALSRVQVVFSGNDGEKIATIDFTSLDKALDNVLKSSFFKTVVSDTFGTIVNHYDKLSFISVNGDLSKIIVEIKTEIEGKDVSEYLGHDLKAVYESFKTLAKSGALDERESSDILKKLSGEYSESTKAALHSLFSMNILRDSTSAVVDLALSKVIDGGDSVQVNGRELSDEEWNSFADSIVNIVASYSDLSDSVDLNSLLADPLSIISDEGIDINKTFTSLGSIIDEVRSIKFLKNAQGKPVVDTLISDNNLPLVESDKPLKLKNGEGNEVTVSNYSELLQFLAQPLNKMKEIDIYSTLKSENVPVTEVFEKLAEALVQDERTLHKIILPLYQVEPTKTLLADLLSGMGDSLIDFSLLNSVEEYEKDLNYITKILKSLNTQNASGEKYLTVLLNGSSQDLLKAIDGELVDGILPPILYAKSTQKVRDEFFTLFSDVYANLIEDDTYRLNTSQITLKEGDFEDQAQEITDIFREFVAFYPTYNNGGVGSLDKIQLGRFLDSVKNNAYRTSTDETLAIHGKTQPGLFAETFNLLVEKVKDAYSVLASQIGDVDYSKINFTEIFTALSKLEESIK